MTPSDLIKVAEDLAGNDDQCYQKSSINRAYYAAYHLVKPLAEKHLGFVENRSKPTHKQLSQYLIDSENEGVKDIGMHLRNLHIQRTSCDYKVDVDVGKNDAKLAILMSKSLISGFAKACKSLKP